MNERKCQFMMMPENYTAAMSRAVMWCTAHGVRADTNVVNGRCMVGRIEDLELRMSHLMPNKSDDI